MAIRGEKLLQVEGVECKGELEKVLALEGRLGPLVLYSQ